MSRFSAADSRLRRIIVTVDITVIVCIILCVLPRRRNDRPCLDVVGIRSPWSRIGSDRSAAAASSSSTASTASVAIAVRAQRTVLSIERDDAASRSPGAVSIVVFTVVVCTSVFYRTRAAAAADGVTHGHGTVCRIMLGAPPAHFDSRARGGGWGGGEREKKIESEREMLITGCCVFTARGTWSESRGKG